MGDMNNMIRQAKEYKDGADILLKARDTWRKEGGKVNFSINTASRYNSCTVELTKASSEKIFKVLIDEYNESISQIKNDIILGFDSLITID